MEKKYEFTDETNIFGHKRIRALRDIPRYTVKKGDLGGFLQSENNLSHNGDCWIADNAEVSYNAIVYGDAIVFGTASVYGNAWVSGNANISGNAKVSGNAFVYDNARVFGHVNIFGDARVYDNAEISGNVNVTKNPVVISGLKYPVTITDNHMQIGCKIHTFEDWNNFTDKDIIAMDGREALNFWNENKDILRAICKNHSKNNP
jgi:NDP-sugar pyrophosphorylase family protein